jgi:hypothetical protein
MDQDLKSRVELSIACVDLPSADLLSKSDPMVVVSLKEDSGTWREIGRTEGVDNNNSPTFLKKIQLDYYFEEAQKLRFDVYDLDAKDTAPLSSHDYLGCFETSLGNIVSAPGQSRQQRLTTKDGSKPLSKGDIKVSAEEIQANADLASISMCANNLCKMDFFGKSDPFCEIWRTGPSGNKILVHKTEVVKVNLNPVWHPFDLRLKSLSGENKSSPIEFKLFDWDGDNTKPDYMGEFKTSVYEILDKMRTGKATFALSKEKDAKAKKPKARGTVSFTKFEIIRNYSFLDYLRGGMQVSLIVCIDFTGSNGDPRDQRSLHYRDPTGQFNQYEQVISSVGSIVAEYDSDQKFPVWGFGGCINKQTSHCFPLGPYGGQECVGIQGIMQAYAAAFSYVTLSGPTHFAEIFEASNRIAAEGCSASFQNYYIVLVLTDGVINDLQKTVDIIVKSTDKPLSFIIVGIGAADFSAMDMLDGDVQPLRSSNGDISKRDIVQFVPYSKFAKMGMGALAKELLAEVPGQVTGFMRSNNLVPLPPRQFIPVPHPLGVIQADPNAAPATQTSP